MLLDIVAVLQVSERTTGWHLAKGRLSPALTLDGDTEKRQSLYHQLGAISHLPSRGAEKSIELAAGFNVLLTRSRRV